MSINSAGPAMPFFRDDDTGEGMTLRDYFAAQALAGILAANYYSNGLTWVPKEAYRYADAMLDAREAGK